MTRQQKLEHLENVLRFIKDNSTEQFYETDQDCVVPRIAKYTRGLCKEEHIALRAYANMLRLDLDGIKLDQ